MSDEPKRTQLLPGQDPSASTEEEGRSAPSPSRSRPGDPAEPSERRQRGPIRDLLGDFSEQMGALFG